jgi:chemosensory pili system protein ChpA (sensor histidine kinase/response regulator)
MSSEFDQRSLVKYFVAEALEGMGVLTKALHPADDSVPTPQQLQEQYIIAHRIRGAASLYGYDGIAKLSEQMEAILEQAQPIPDADWPRAVGALRETVQGIQMIVQALSAGGGRRSDGGGAMFGVLGRTDSR